MLGKVVGYRYAVVIEYHFSNKRLYDKFSHGHFLYIAANNRVQIFFYVVGRKVCVIALLFLSYIKVKSCNLRFEFF